MRNDTDEKKENQASENSVDERYTIFHALFDAIKEKDKKHKH